MALDSFMTLAVVAAAAGLLSLAAGPLLRLVAGRAEGVLRRAGFEKDQDHYVLRRDDVEVRATIRSGVLRLEGPPLPPNAPVFRATADGMSIGPADIWSGDLAFDRVVRTVHDDPHVALAWLSVEIRRSVLDVVRRSASQVDDRWRFEGPLTPMLDVACIAQALACASTAMSSNAPESVNSGLERLACTDPVPAVRAHAIDVLGERQANPTSLASLTDSCHVEVLLALIRHGGTGAVAAWDRLLEVGTPSARRDGAVAAAQTWQGSQLWTDDVENRIVPTLLACLAHDRVNKSAARALARMHRPTLRREVEDHFTPDMPPAARSLCDRLARREAGAVSLASAEGGAVALAEDEPSARAAAHGASLTTGESARRRTEDGADA